MVNQRWNDVRRLLVARLDNIGDVVMCGPAIRALRAGFPEATITLWVSPGGTAAASLLPAVDDAIATRAIWQDLGHLPYDPVRERKLVDEIAARRFDGIVIFTSFAQSPYPPAYVAYLAGIPRRAGQSREFGGSLLTDWVEPLPDASHQVDRNLHLVDRLGVPRDGDDLRLAIPDEARGSVAAKLRSRGVPGGAPYVVIHPGASCPSRVYPQQRFADVARHLGEKTGLPIVLSGSDREASLGDAIRGVVPDAISLVGQTTVPELAALVEGATLLIANNTAVMHLADAVATPGVILFAGTELEEQWRPRKTNAALLRRPTPCAPCYAFTCPIEHQCLDIPATEVVDAAITVLSRVWQQRRRADVH